MKPLKILLTHERFAPDFAGGGEYVVLETARHLLKRGMEVRVFTTGDSSMTSYEGIQTTRLPIHRYRLNFAVDAITEAARDIDLIHTFNYHACLPSLYAGRRIGKPVICELLGLFGRSWLEMRGPLAGRLWQRIERYLLCRPFSRLIFISNYSRQIGIGLGAPAERSIVNFPGIDLDQYGPADPKDDAVLFSGKLDVRKGIYDFLAVARALPDVRFRIMGWGPNENTIRKQASPNVEFIPYERGAPLRRAFSHARIFLFPSKAETFGIAVAEAMASGCAVVSTIPLRYEGALVNPGDRTAMIEAVRGMWHDREGTGRMGLRNCELAQVYSWERYTDVNLRLYQEVLDEVRQQRF